MPMITMMTTTLPLNVRPKKCDIRVSCLPKNFAITSSKNICGITMTASVMRISMLSSRAAEIASQRADHHP